MIDPIAENNLTAADYLRQAAHLIEQRGKQRDSPSGERSMERAVAAFNALTDRDLPTHEGWLFMQCLKHARKQYGVFHLDDYLDTIAYAALETEQVASL